MAQQTQNEHTSTDLRSPSERNAHPLVPCRKTPTAPAARITRSSGIFFVNIRITSVTNPMRTVGRSTRDRRARMYAAPAIAPTTDAVTPCTNALTCRVLAQRRQDCAPDLTVAAGAQRTAP